MNLILFENPSSEIPSSDRRYRHILKVLKLEAGDRFKAGIVNGPVGEAEILSIDSKRICYAFHKTGECEKLFPVTLVLAQVRPICMKRILREAASLGVEKIVLTVCDLSEASYLKSKLYTTGSYRSILLDGAMQAGGSAVPSVVFASSVDEALTCIPSEGQRVLLDNVIGAERLSSYRPESPSQVLAIGPERGFTARERSLFLSQKFAPFTIGSRILRTETASSAGLALLLGRMQLI